VLALDDPWADLAAAGGKGASLARLAAAGLPVPGGFHVTTDAYRQFVAVNHLQPRILAALEAVEAARPATLDTASQAIGAVFAAGQIPPAVAGAIAQAYAALPGQDPAVAVRSSATAEDLPGASFAGQQETYLNVRGTQRVLRAVQKCWASLWTARAIGYRARQGIAPEEVALAVAVQLLVPAEAAGILFTANPVTGARAQAVISAAWGLGEAVVGGQVTPDALTVDKVSGKVLERHTADKRVMTARTPSADGGTGTAEQPVPEGKRRAAVLSDAQVAELARLGTKIEELYGVPMDVEWALADGQFAILQARPITALPEPELPAPTEWKLPKGAYAAMRNNIVELMANPLSPLFATLGCSAINTSLQRVLGESFGMRGVMPAEIIIVINGYAYNNGSLRPRGLARVIFGAVPILRNMFTGAVERWTETGRPRYHQIVETWRASDWRGLSAAALVDAARELTGAAIDAYAALVSGVIPAAWITEAAFTSAYNRLVRRRGDPLAAAFLLGYDSLPIRADKALYDLAAWARQQPALRDHLDVTPTPRLARLDENAPAGVAARLWQDWRQRFQAHLRQFGHTLYDLDFANPVPADDPAPVLDALKLYLRGQGVDPHARQHAAAQRREQAVQAMDQRLVGWRRRLFHRLLAPAQKYAPLREDGLAEIGLAYPLIRQMLRELGDRFARQGVITAANDVFWLTEAEVGPAAAALDAGQPAETLAGRIPGRKARRTAAQRATPPMALPQMKVFGFDLMSLKRRRGRGGQGAVIKGVAASPGQVTAVARVLRGPEDFGLMQPGEVLVAAITTPAWTPLFAMASAVVTDVGGPLSHGSIVAREYGIPAVLGTGVATRRIRSGQRVMVDGGAGTVALSANGEIDHVPIANEPAGD
jgi:pyruvate,water dikinase